MSRPKPGSLAGAVHGAATGGRRRKTAAGTARDGPPPSRAGKRGIVIYVEPDTARALKILAAQRETTIQALGTEALENILAEQEVIAR